MKKSNKTQSFLAELSDNILVQIKGVAGFQISITEIQVAYKLLQTQNESNHKRIVKVLLKTGDENSKAIAKAMCTYHNKS